MSQISGPLLDRIDIQVEILPVPFEQLSSANAGGESSAEIRARVIRARAIQTERYRHDPKVHCNAQMGPKHMTEFAALDDTCTAILRDAMIRLDMSARAYDRIIRVSRTIADIEGSDRIQSHHIREAISYRNLDRSTWGAYMPANQ